tara:strand:+ start:594 stop:1148 length:555 start_codon:yes stop_codon:yes gene_type:complete
MIMRKIILFYTAIMILSFFSSVNAKYNKLAYEFSFDSIDDGEIKLKDYENKIIVVVNVASRCGYTPQYSGLQELATKYKDNLIVIGVPSNNFKQEPGNENEIKEFCEVNFNITFPLTKKINVIGKNAHPFFKWAKDNHGLAAIPKWNFHKIIVGKNGKILDTFASFTKPTSKKFVSLIEKEIKN